ncbi:MAG: hypothetical protein LUH45_02105 [Clostridiales bacterium]|nr:hypothetical protein [Clostridiales bacterium]
MKGRVGALLLALCLAVGTLTGCGGGNTEQSAAPAELVCASADAISEATGFAMQELTISGAEATSYTVLNGTVGQIDYAYDGTVIELRMSVSQEDYEGLYGLLNGRNAGGIQYADSKFSDLDVWLLEDTYYCEFTYGGADGTLYFSLSQTDGSFTGFADILLTLVEQIAPAEESEEETETETEEEAAE